MRRKKKGKGPGRIACEACGERAVGRRFGYALCMSCGTGVGRERAKLEAAVAEMRRLAEVRS